MMREDIRKERVAKYGSFLVCPQRDTLCSNMEERWKTGCDCSLKPCILDDPEYIALKEKQKRNMQKRLIEERELLEEEKNAAPIRRQTKTWEELQHRKIARLEAESRRAYRKNMTGTGERKLHEAIMMRKELRRREERRGQQP